MRDKPMFSRRSPESAVTEMGVSCNDSTFFRAVTTTSSKVALTPVGKVAIAMKHITLVIFRLNANNDGSRNDLLLGGIENWENFCSKLAMT